MSTVPDVKYDVFVAERSDPSGAARRIFRDLDTCPAVVGNRLRVSQPLTDRDRAAGFRSITSYVDLADYDIVSVVTKEAPPCPNPDASPCDSPPPNPEPPRQRTVGISDLLAALSGLQRRGNS